MINVHEAKTQLSRLSERAHNGEQTIIAKNGLPWARLVPLEAPKKRELGFMAGQASLPDNFFDPMTEEELQDWEGGTHSPPVGDGTRKTWR